MEINEAIKLRRSVRKFSSKQVPKELLNEIIHSGAWAPSACNGQDWHFIIIDDDQLKKSLYGHGGSAVLKGAPTVILVLYSNQTLNLEYADHVQSASAAIQNMLLAACERGLASCWICHLPSKRVLRKLFFIPNFYDPIAAVALGYPENQPVAVTRKYAPSDIVSFNKFERKHLPQKTSCLNLKRFFLTVYKIFPFWLKRTFFNKFLDQRYVKKFEN